MQPENYMPPYRPDKSAEIVGRIGGRMRAAALRGDAFEVARCLSGIVAQVRVASAAGKLADLETELKARGLA